MASCSWRRARAWNPSSWFPPNGFGSHACVRAVTTDSVVALPGRAREHERYTVAPIDVSLGQWLQLTVTPVANQSSLAAWSATVEHSGMEFALSH